MTGTAIDTKAAVEVAKSAAGILPQEGKTVVLDHLVSGMTPEALKALSPEAREKLLQALTGTEAARMATREENRAYVEGLLAKEDNNTINDAEKNALQTYRERYVRDTAGGLDVAGRRVRAYALGWNDDALPDLGALFVRASAESK